MKNKIYSRSVTIRDNNMDRWTIEFEVREIEPSKRKNAKTLEEFDERFTVSVCGEGNGCCGQCYGSIFPRTPGQEGLLRFWKKYHFGGMASGTELQEGYLKSEQYQEEYKKFLNLFSDCNGECRDTFSESMFDAICSTYKVFPEYDFLLKQVIEKHMGGNPVKYILGSKYSVAHNADDYCVKCLFLAIRGMYVDRDYKYGNGWLYLPIPGDIRKKIDNLCETLQNEEKQLSESLAVPGDFDMGAEDFKATRYIIEKVMEMRDCNEEEAKRFVALGIHLQLTFGDLNDTFQSNGDCLYEANGTEYYIGTDEELEQIASDRVYDDDEYEYLWREAVAAKRTTDSLKDWLKSVIDDGWCNILNSWDGKYEEYNIDGEWICVSRT